MVTMVFLIYFNSLKLNKYNIRHLYFYQTFIIQNH